ncbi:MAG: hypothetical protein F6J87_04355 [Spirulina sp. SIO3F2]|nr:hypothetical protein [Spirulina sp. SIO3F2]
MPVLVVILLFFTLNWFGSQLGSLWPLAWLRTIGTGIWILLGLGILGFGIWCLGDRQDLER